MSHIHILAADDDPEDLELIEDAILTIEPAAEMQKVNNGKAVIEYLNSLDDDFLPCLIILDYNMAELTGAEVVSQICRQQRFRAIPVVILSTSSAPLHIHECISNGATEYFVKPDNYRELESVAKKMLSFCIN